MKKKLLTLAVMMLCIVMMLSSCALTLKFNKFVQKDFAPETDSAPTEVKKIDLKGDNPSDYYDSDDLVVRVETGSTNSLNTTTVYNVATDNTIWTGTDTESQTGSGDVKVRYAVTLKNLYVEDETISLVYVTKVSTTIKDSDVDIVYDMTIITESGATVVELKDIDMTEVESSSWKTADLLCVDGKVYRISANGGVSIAFDWSDLREPPEYLTKAGDYYVTGEDNTVLIYDSNLNMTAAYSTPIYDAGDDALEEFFNINVLSNGNVLVQYLVLQDVMADKYTFLMQGQKYNLYSVLVQAKNGKTKELDLDYLITQVGSSQDLSDLGISEKIDNLVLAATIEDKRINMDEASAKLLSITNDGKIAGVVAAPIPNASLAAGVGAVAKNRWEISTVDGRTFLLNEKGDVIGETSGSTGSNDSVLVVNKKVYDWNLNLKIDLAEEDAQNLIMMNNGILFDTDKDEVKLYINGEVETIISESEAEEGKKTFKSLSKSVYMITDTTETDAKYKIYDEQGTLLSTITDSVYAPSVVKKASNGALLLAAQLKDGSGTVYYRVG